MSFCYSLPFKHRDLNNLLVICLEEPSLFVIAVAVEDQYNLHIQVMLSGGMGIKLFKCQDFELNVTRT